MPTTKLIYGVGRIPKASEFALGEIIVNVDDSKVFSKSKSNVVFEIGGGGNNTTNNITEGDTVTTISGFNTASISSSGFFTSADTANLIISGGTGVRVTTGSNNQIIITATGEAETTIVNAETASYVEVAQTASYVDTSNLDGNLFQLSNDGDQGGVIFSENNINIFSDVSAFVGGLRETDNVTFNSITASSDITASGDIFAKRLLLPQSSQGNIAEGGIVFGTEGSNGQILDDGNSLQIGYDGSDVLTVSGSDPYTKLSINGNTRIATGHLKIEGNITASNPNGVSGMGNISASGLLFASASQPAAHAGSIVAVVYDTSSGQFYYTGSYGAGGSGADNDWFIDTVNSKLTASLDLLLTSSNQHQHIYFNSGNVNDVSHIKNAYISNTISDTTYGQEIKLENYYNEGVIELEIGEKPFVTAKKNANPVVVINDNVSDIDFNVKGDIDTALIYANAGTDKVGIGYNTPGQKLSVNGNIYSNGYLLLQNKANTVGVAGALLYSSSNEFYLGFS